MARHFEHEDATYGSRAPDAPTVGRGQPLPRYYGSTSPYAAQELSASAVSTGNSNSFDWNDYAIGIATGLGVALVLAAALLVGRHQRHRPQPA
jgi:hypothetical protein